MGNYNGDPTRPEAEDGSARWAWDSAYALDLAEGMLIIMGCSNYGEERLQASELHVVDPAHSGQLSQLITVYSGQQRATVIFQEGAMHEGVQRFGSIQLTVFHDQPGEDTDIQLPESHTYLLKASEEAGVGVYFCNPNDFNQCVKLNLEGTDQGLDPTALAFLRTVQSLERTRDPSGVTGTATALRRFAKQLGIDQGF